MKAFICGLVLLALLVCPVSAFIANDTDMHFKSPTYIPYQYELFLIGMGIACWFLMKYFNDLEVLFGFIAILIFGATAWLAAYISVDNTFPVVHTHTGVTTLIYTTQVTPQPILQIILVVCFLFAIIAEIYVVFLRESDKTIDKQSLVKRG